MYKDPPRRILDLLFTGLLILFFVSLYFRDILPDQILGLNKAFCLSFLIVGALAAKWGSRLLDWIRRRNFGG